MESLDSEINYLYFKGKELIESLAWLSELYCDKYCIAEGLAMCARESIWFGKNQIEPLSYANQLKCDYLYFAFAKSIKSLKAIVRLLNDDEEYFSEDILQLSRSILENHIYSRHVKENIKGNGSERDNQLIKSFLQGPLAYEHRTADMRNGQYIYHGEIYGGLLKIGNAKSKDTGIYFHQLYEFLSGYVHLNFGKVENYFYDGSFSVDMERDNLISVVITLFCFIKIYESVVNVEGEDFEDDDKVIPYCDITYDTLEYLHDTIDFLIFFFSTRNCRVQDYYLIHYYGTMEAAADISTGERISNMFKAMKASLDDDSLSDLVKNRDEDGKYIREYILG